jgi:hypothetical protein
MLTETAQYHRSKLVSERRIDMMELLQLSKLYGKPPQYFLSLD